MKIKYTINNLPNKYNTRVGTLLQCVKDVIMEDSGIREITKGKYYTVVSCDEYEFELVNDNGDCHYFNFDDEDGNIWFKLAT